MYDGAPLAERSDFESESQHRLELAVAAALRRRPRVDAKIAEEFSTYPILVVAGPSGIGKTVALHDGFDSIRVAPTIIRAQHESLASLMRSLVDREAIAGRISAEPPPVDDLSPSDLSAWLSERLLELGPVIVLEDLHLVTHDERFVSALRNLIESTIPRTRWVLVTRMPDVLPIASWMAKGYLGSVVDEAVLRFSDEEADSYLRLNVPYLTDDERAAIAEMTDGWAALLALSTSAPISSLRRVRPNASRNALFDYLAHEIFEELADADQAFLLQTCLFPRIDPDFLWRYANVVSPQATIRRLQRRVPLIHDAESGTFYYHKLLQDFLKRVLLARGEDAYGAAVRAAAATCTAGGWNAAAVDLLIEVGDHVAIESLLVDRGLWMADHGESDVAQRAIASLPMSARRHPVVRTLDAAYGGHCEAGFSDETFAEIWEDAKGQPYAAAICARYVRHLNDQRRPLPPGFVATVLADERLSPAGRGRIWGAAAMNFVRLGQTDEAKRALSRAWEIYKHHPISEEVLGSTYLTHALILYQEGDRDEAITYVSRARDIARRHHRYPLAAAVESAGYDIAYSHGDFEEAHRCADEMRNYALASGLASHEQRALLHLTSMASLTGDEIELDRLVAALGEHEIVDEISHARVMPVALAFRSGAHGEFDSALEYVLDTESILEAFPHLYRSRCAHIALFAAASGRRDLVDGYLARALGKVSVPNSRRDTLILLFCATAALLVGRRDAAHRLIAATESKSARVGRADNSMIAATRAFYCWVTEPGSTTLGDFQRMCDVLRSDGYVVMAQVLEQIRTSRASEIAPSDRFALLTEAERDVFSLIAMGLSNPDISRKRGTTNNTTKRQVGSIIAKLSISGRKELVTYAQARLEAQAPRSDHG